MLTPAHWISPDGLQLDVQTSHIAEVIADPTRFSVTEEWLRSVYVEYGEGHQYGCEGRAREAVIRTLVLDGWIRTRWYIQRATYWSLTVGEMDEWTRKRLSEWVNRQRDRERLTDHSELRITVLRSPQTITGEVAEITGML